MTKDVGYWVKSDLDSLSPVSHQTIGYQVASAAARDPGLYAYIGAQWVNVEQSWRRSSGGRANISSLTPVFDLTPLEVASAAAAVHVALGTQTIAGSETTTLIGYYTTFEIDGSDAILGEGIRVEVETSGDDDAQQVRCLMGYATVSGAGLAKALHGKAVATATATVTAVLTGVIGQCEVNVSSLLASRCFQASITGETDITDGLYMASNGARNFRVGINMADAATYAMAAILLPVDSVAAGIRWGTTGDPGGDPSEGARINSPVSNQLNLDATGLLFLNSTNIKLGAALQAVGGGASATLGTIGGSGPTVETQNSWLQLIDNAGVTMWVPVWK